MVIELVAQEIQCSVLDCSPEAQAHMAYQLIEAGFPESRFSIFWDTWKGIHVTPPLDELRWSLEEFTMIWDLLDKVTNVLMLDKPVEGLTGQARSTA